MLLMKVVLDDRWPGGDRANAHLAYGLVLWTMHCLRSLVRSGQGALEFRLPALGRRRYPLKWMCGLRAVVHK